VWTETITISEWHFKPAGSSEDGKRRVDDIRPANDEVRHMAGHRSTVIAAAADATATDAPSESIAAEDVIDDIDSTAVMTDDDTILMETDNL